MSTEIVKINTEKVNEIKLLDSEQKREIIDAIQYNSIPYFPITKPFIQKYILNDVEYPLIESKISQSSIELSTRVNKIIQQNYEYNKALLELEELEIDLEDIEDGEYRTDRHKNLAVNKQQLEIQMKQYQIKILQDSVKTTYKEILNWKNTIAEYVEKLKAKNPDVKSPDDIDLDMLRMAEMRVKVGRWRAMNDAGHGLTPSQQILVDDERIQALNGSNPKDASGKV